MASSARGAYADFLNTFSNVLFAVSLFVVWGVLTLIGVVVDQGKEPSAYFAAYPAPIARAIVRLGFDNIYHSPWYVGIIGLILVSLAVCTFKRVIPARLPPLHPVNVEKMPLHVAFDVDANEGAVRAFAERFFAARGWQVRKREFGGTEWSFADRHNWARRGVLVAHIGFVIIAAGTTLYWARGFSGETAVLTGQTVQIPQTHALLRLDSFAYKIQPIQTKSGMVYQPIDFVSHVTVTGRDGVAKPMIVRVNHPIDVDGTLYYQASYGFGMRFLVTKDGKPVPSISNPTYQEGDDFALPGTQLAIAYQRFVPTVDRQSGRPSADPRVNDPATLLDVTQGGNDAGETLVPLGTGVDLGGGWRVTPQRYVIYSGFQYRYDPGVPLVGIGAFVLLSGLVIAFYLLPARLYVRVDPTQSGGSRLGVAATTVKGYDIYESEFARLIGALVAEIQRKGALS